MEQLVFDLHNRLHDHAATMVDLVQQLALRFRVAVTAAFGEEYADADPVIARAKDPKFGDYQANLAMSLGRKLGQNPRKIAEQIVAKLDVSDICTKVEIAGPGFINLHLKNNYLAEQLAELAAHPTPQRNGQLVVVDYGGPNLAKEMHVGHLRSTIIGDAIVRVLEYLGCDVIRQNHVGDWGTQFGMLVEQLLDSGWQAGSSYDIGDLNVFYQAAKKRFDDEPAFADRARQRVVKLQAGDEQTLVLWRQFVGKSMEHCEAVYAQLDVLLSPADVRGESFYNDRLAPVIDGLQATGLLRESQGAQVVFPQGFKDKEGQPLPMIVRKSDGGYLYATTDLAAAWYRIDELKASRIIYVVDSRQSQHLAMVFQTLRETGWAPAQVRLDHVPFGTVLGKDRKPFKTRSGELLKLVDLLNEAEQRAAKVLAEKGVDFSGPDAARIAHVVGIGALKYADLSTERIKDYVFDWDRMLAMEGNTAPYLVNAYVRIKSIFRKAERETHGLQSVGFGVEDSAERTLALSLLQFPAVIASVGEHLEPHRLCNYLYDLASSFHQFYERCSVLNAPDDATRASRLALCGLTADVLRRGLDLLGIETVEQM